MYGSHHLMSFACVYRLEFLGLHLAVATWPNVRTGRPWAHAMAPAVIPLWGVGGKGQVTAADFGGCAVGLALVDWVSTSTCSSWARSILVAEPILGCRGASTSCRRTSPWPSSLATCLVVETVEMERQAKLRNQCRLQQLLRWRPMEMEEHLGNRAMNAALTQALQKQLHQLRGLVKRPTGLSGGDWTCSHDNVGDGGYQWLWRALSWCFLSCKTWLGMLLRASTTTTSSCRTTPSSPLSRSWTPCFNTRKKLNYQRGVKSSSSSSSENAKKSYKPTWWDTPPCWRSSRTCRLTSHLCLQDGIFWRDRGCRGGHIHRSKLCAMAIWPWRVLQDPWLECLAVTASPMQRTPPSAMMSTWLTTTWMTTRPMRPTTMTTKRPMRSTTTMTRTTTWMMPTTRTLWPTKRSLRTLTRQRLWLRMPTSTTWTAVARWGN